MIPTANLVAIGLGALLENSVAGVPGQIVALREVFVLVALVSDGTWAFVATAAGAWFGRSPKRMAGLSTTGGTMMIGLGASVLLLGHNA